MTSQPNTFIASFIIRKSKQSKSIIYLRLSLNKERIEISTKEKIDTHEWDKAKECIKGRTIDAQKTNIILDRLKEDSFRIYKDLVFEEKVFSVYDIKNRLLGIKEHSHTLIEVFNYHMEIAKNSLSNGTCKNFKGTQRIFESFLKEELKRNDIHLIHLNYKFIKDFENYIYKRNAKGVVKPCGHNSMVKHIVRLRKVIRLALENDWLHKDPFSKYKVSYNKTKREHLTQDELNNIEFKDFKIERLEQIRDVFIFSCYTGLAYIDAQNLTNANLTVGIDGEVWISTSRAKTDTSVRIPLLPPAKRIIQKYQFNPKVMHSGKLIPTISNQKLNAYLKEVADVCGIQKVLTSHMARHTFATTVTLTNGVPIESVSKMLGHSSIRTTQIYAKVIDKKVGDDMRDLKNLLSQNQKKIVNS